MSLRRLAGTLADVAPNPPLRLRQAVVQSAGSARVTIRLEGTTVDIANVRYLASYSPTAGDSVWLLQQGPLVLVLGELA